MTVSVPQEIKVEVERGAVTALIYDAATPVNAVLILGHGAGAGQMSDFMAEFAKSLSRRGVDAVTFNFPYTERGKRLPDRGPVLEECYRRVYESVRGRAGSKKLFIGGKSMGGRIASQVAARGLDDLRGLVFLGYPLHPPGKPDQLRAAHLPKIGLPMMFIQGERDAFGTPAEIEAIVKKLKPRPRIHAVNGGDHSLKVPKSSGRTREDVHAEVQDAIVAWLTSAG